MGLFDRLFGRPRPSAPPATPLGPDGDESFMVAVENNGVMMVMDRESYEFQYGLKPRPNPSQGVLDQALGRTTRLRVRSGGLFRGRSLNPELLVETTDPAELARFRDAVRISTGGDAGRCMCPGGPTIELLADEEVVAAIGLQHGRAIRMPVWGPDAQLVDGTRLTAWLHDNGVLPEVLELLYHGQYPGGINSAGGGMTRIGDGPLTRAEQWARLGDMARTGGDWKLAGERCDRALADDPNCVFARAVRGLFGAHDEATDAAVAEADCTAALAAGYPAAALYPARAVARDRLGNPHEAIADCDAALAADPTLANAFNSRGLIRGRLGRVDEALKDYDEAIRLAPEWWVPRMNRGMLVLAAGLRRDAVPDFDIAIDGARKEGNNPPSLVTLYRARADAHRAAGNKTKADADLASADRLALANGLPRSGE